MNSCSRKCGAVVSLCVASAMLLGCRSTAPLSPPAGDPAMHAPYPMMPFENRAFGTPPALDLPNEPEPLLPGGGEPPAPRPLRVPSGAASPRDALLDEATLFPADRPQRNPFTRRDPVSEPVENQRKLLPFGVRPPRVLEQMSEPLRRILGRTSTPSRKEPLAQASVAHKTHAAGSFLEFVSHSSTLHGPSRQIAQAEVAPPAWVAHSLGR